MLPWELAPDLPWSPLSSPVERWAVMPSFVVGEYLFYACAVVALLHARRHGRAHLLVWVAALLAGTANDMLFMALPVVDNFWQAQATIMLTPRLPLYIPCVYICFMYFSTVTVWRLGLPRLAAAALTGLLAELFYAPYDIVGAKFSWWTWHDTDLLIGHRLLGAPVGSTLWVITFVAGFSGLLSVALRRDPQVGRRAVLWGLGLTMGLCSLQMMVQVRILQLFDGGVPGPAGLVAAVVVYLALTAWGWRRREPPALAASDRPLQVAAVAYFATLAAIMAVFDPATHRNESMHQTYGPCHEVAYDIMGLRRYRYVCAEDFDEDYTFDCLDRRPEPMAEWYTVCGRPHRDFPRFMAGVAILCALGIAAYGTTLRGRALGRALGRAPGRAPR
ncbi:MAG: hypothetical protein KDK70_31640 [Myxococcales bacterium]|nr:hypothetical protein [Myxococcales bacterium]